MNCNCHSAAES